MEYIITRDGNSEELTHYGVLGMKWGVRRASRVMQTTNSSSKFNRATNKLAKHETKINENLRKLESKNPELKRKAQRSIERADRTADRLERKSFKMQKKASRTLDNGRAQYRYRKAENMRLRAQELREHNTKEKSKLDKNERLQKEFRKGLSDISQARIDYGKRYTELVLSKSRS